MSVQARAQAIAAATARLRGGPLAGPLLFYTALTLVIALTTWDGLGPRDAERYIDASLRWIEEGPHLGETHWSLRFPLVAPMTAAFAAAGVSPLAAAAPNITFSLLTVIVTFLFARRYFDAVTAHALTILVATSGYIVMQAAEIRVYGPELFFAALALWLALAAVQAPQKAIRLWTFAGLASGGAWLCRESTLFLPAVVGLLALVRSGGSVKPAIAVSAGFVGVVAVETAAYAVAAGDPFYRYKIDLGHGRGQAGTQPGLPAGDQPIAEFIWTPFSELFTYPTVTPFVVAAMMAGAFLLTRRRALLQNAALALSVFTGAALFSFILSAYALSLEDPDYHPLLVYAALMACATALGALVTGGRKFIAAIALAGLTVTSFAAADFRDYDEYSEAELLAKEALARDEPIYSDKLTVMRAQRLARLMGATRVEAEHLLIASAPPRGALVFQATPAGRTPLIDVAPDWREIGRFSPRPRSWTRTLIKSAAMQWETPLPASLAGIVSDPPQTVLYRTPD